MNYKRGPVILPMVTPLNDPRDAYGHRLVVIGGSQADDRAYR